MRQKKYNELKKKYLGKSFICLRCPDNPDESPGFIDDMKERFIGVKLVCPYVNYSGFLTLVLEHPDNPNLRRSYSFRPEWVVPYEEYNRKVFEEIEDLLNHWE